MTCLARLLSATRHEPRRQNQMPETHCAPAFAQVAAESSRADHLPRPQRRARIRPSRTKARRQQHTPMTHVHALFDTVRAETRRQEHML